MFHPVTALTYHKPVCNTSCYRCGDSSSRVTPVRMNRPLQRRQHPLRPGTSWQNSLLVDITIGSSPSFTSITYILLVTSSSLPTYSSWTPPTRHTTIGPAARSTRPFVKRRRDAVAPCSSPNTLLRFSRSHDTQTQSFNPII